MSGTGEGGRAGSGVAKRFINKSCAKYSVEVNRQLFPLPEHMYWHGNNWQSPLSHSQAPRLEHAKDPGTHARWVWEGMSRS